MSDLAGDLSSFLTAFHFLRPLWLLLLPIILTLWWRQRRPPERAVDKPSLPIAPHLARALSVGERDRAHWPRFLPIDALALLLALLTLATAGPAWTRLPDSLMGRTAPLVIAVQVNQSMTETDVAPSRLERAKQKVYDLLKRRDGAPTALIAYAGTAHRVVPLTEDQNLLRPYVEGLAADIMPVAGNHASSALNMAQSILQQAGTSGGILFLNDGIETTDVAHFNQRNRANTLGMLILLPSSAKIPGAEQVHDARVERVTPDTRDIEGFVRYFDSGFRQALARDENLQWDDRGWWLAWPAALLALLWFRRGWMLPATGSTTAFSIPSSTLSTRAGASVGLVLCIFSLLYLLTPWVTAQTSNAQTATTSTTAVPQGPPANAFLSRLFTPDQLGQWLMQRKEYARAADAFADVYHRGYAQYQAGHYEDAANTLAPLDAPEAIFTRAMAQVKSGQYQDAITGFEQVLQIDPNFPGAQENLQLSREILTYMEKSRGEEEEKYEQTESDDDRYDEQQQQEMEAPPTPVSGTEVNAEQWMSTLDTSTSEFLKQRFAVEAASAPAPESTP
ncbi:vWA domain-containing protein [Microbulbifer agarilyticus]|uniref:vWA domain-containing protein n=1 Tax=Microbulbifer agarilyticus TaxID=260552 RepID=UPI001CD1EE08|nr:VWA domain-containing protein [Microbulbifer agarilyticus]MCA0901149.1 VWA domain-containing protein [Microbulbifer agarilyticus]